MADLIFLSQTLKMMNLRSKYILVALGGMTLSHNGIASEVYKCQAPTGRTVYSDVPCNKIGAKPVGVVNTTPNAVPALKIPLSRSHSPAPHGNGVAAPAPPSRPARDLEARRLRENELNNFLISLASTPEQKSAAREEMTLIASRGGVCRFSEDQRKTRDGLYNDLGSLVQSRRVAARGPLLTLLSSCDTM